MLDRLKSAGGWTSSRLLYGWLRPKYGQSSASSKSMQRALSDLVQAGHVECTGRGSARSVRVQPGHFPSKTEIQSVELAVALLQVERLASNLLPAEALSSLRAYCDQGRALLNNHPTFTGYAQGKAWIGKSALIDSGYPLLPPPLDAQVLNAITDALYRNKMLSLRYRNATRPAAPTSTYHISPLALVERGSVLYLVSCKQSRRSTQYSRYLHRLDRIQNAVVSDDPANLDNTFNLEHFIKHEHALLFFPELPERITLQVIERGFRSRLRDYRLAEDQTITETANGFELNATVRPSLTFKQFLLGLIPDTIVLAPERLRNELHDLLSSASRAYASDQPR